MNIDVFGQCTTCEVDFSKVPEVIKQQIEYELNIKIDCNNFIMKVTKEIVNKYHIQPEAICKVSYKLDTIKLEQLISQFIPYAPHFLVFSEKNPWNGYPGYYYCNTALEAIERPMETQIFIKDNGVNAIKCYEVPYNTIEGTDTYIVGITNEDYDNLFGTDYIGLEEFVKSKFS